MKWLSFLIVLGIAPLVLAAEVNMAKAPPKVVRNVFDPAKPPKGMPELKHGESAVTEYVFKIELDVRFAPGMVDAAPGGGVRAAVTIHGVNVRLALPITIWVPNDADAHLKAHEEGHRALAEMFYKDAEMTARTLAQDLIGRRIEGTGPNKDAAYRAALESVSKTMSEKYIAAVKGPCDDAQKIYEEITAHAANRGIPSEKAVQQAMEKWREAKKK